MTQPCLQLAPNSEQVEKIKTVTASYKTPAQGVTLAARWLCY